MQNGFEKNCITSLSLDGWDPQIEKVGNGICWMKKGICWDGEGEMQYEGCICLLQGVLIGIYYIFDIGDGLRKGGPVYLFRFGTSK
jgi:hypothetical protein